MFTNFFYTEDKDISVAPPSFDEYVEQYRNLFTGFLDSMERQITFGRPCTYSDSQLIIFFTIMMSRRVYDFKTQHRWLMAHSELANKIGFVSIPDRTTLSRRWKKLYSTLTKLIEYVGKSSSQIDEMFNSDILYEDSSVFRARGGIWHAKDRQRDPLHPPKGARNIDLDANWTKSAYHSFVYGYKLHLTTNFSSFPKLVSVESANVSDSTAIDNKEVSIINLAPKALITDNGYCQASRIKKWNFFGVNFLTPAVNWKNTKPARDYHTWIAEPQNERMLCYRKVVIEPIFAIIPIILGTRNNHKQLPVSRLSNVRTLLSLAVLFLQVAMLMNNKRGISLRSINDMLVSFC